MNIVDITEENREELRRHSEQTKALIKKLFPDRKGEQVSKGSREASGVI